MKIAILNTLYHPYRVGGAEVSVQLLAEGLAGQGHTVSVITLHEGRQPSVEQAGGVTLYRLPVRNLYWPFGGHPSRLRRLLWHVLDTYNPLARADVSRLLRQIQPDLLHTNNLAGFSVAVWDAARAVGIPVVHTSRDYYLIHPNCTLYSGERNQDPRSLSCRLFSLVRKWRSHQVQHYVGISEHVSELHQRLGYFRQAPAEVIYNSISQPAATPPRASDKGTVLGYMGRIEPAKGLETALQACRRLGPGFSLRIAGKGDSAYVARLQAAYADLDLTWLGHSAPEAFFPSIDIMLVPSQWAEPLGRVVLEASSYGVPVVGSDAGGIPEIIRPGETGFACPAGDVDAFVAAVQRLARSDRTLLREHCLAWAAQFSGERITARYLRAYQSLDGTQEKPLPATQTTV